MPISGKILEWLLYDSVFELFTEKTLLISLNQLGFKTGDLCIDQLLSNKHEIYISFDYSYEVRRVFWGICKAFDKVWHSGLLYKLRQNSITVNLLNILADFL